MLDPPKDLWATIFRQLAAYDLVKKDSTRTLIILNKTQTKFIEAPNRKLSDKLSQTYEEILEETEKEGEVILEILKDIDILIPLRESAELEPKRKKRKLGHVIEGNETEAVAPGTLVAVRMSTMDVEWMMCKIVKFYPDEKEYTLRDIDEDSARSFRKRRSDFLIVPVWLPDKMPSAGKNRRRSATSPPPVEQFEELDPGTRVLALYPDSTCLYRATVVKPPSQIPDAEYPYRGLYLVMFEEEHEARSVAPNRVVLHPEEDRKHR